MPTATAEAPTAKSAPQTISLGEIPLAGIAPAPWQNTRAKPSEDSVRALAQTIEQVGLLQPLVVMRAGPGHAYILVAGNRRLAALRQLGRQTAAATELVLPEGQSAEQIGQAAMIVENAQREAPDALREAAAVERLLESPQHTPETVAAELGWPVRVVHRRAKLLDLSKASRAACAPGGAIADWPTLWLEELALLPEDQQAALLAELKRGVHITSHGSLREVVAALMHALSSAPWELGDGQLDPKAGSCAACSKHTAAIPELFDDGTKQLSKARCLDGSCFARKLQLWRAATLEATRKEHGKSAILIEGKGGDHFARYGSPEALVQTVEGRTQRKQRGPEIHRTYDLEPAKAGEKGAIAAVVASGADIGKLRWVKKRDMSSGYSSSVRPPKPKKGPKSMAQKREQLGRRRRRHVVLAARKQLDAWARGGFPADVKKRAAADPKWLAGLVAAWGAAAPEKLPLLNYQKRDYAGHARARRALAGWDATPERVLAGLLPQFQYALGRKLVNFPEDHCFGELVAMLSLEALGQDELLNKLQADALRELPDPKSWAKQKAGAIAAPAKKAKGKKAAKVPAKKARAAKAGAA